MKTRILDAGPADAPAEVAGLTVRERTRRALARAGLRPGDRAPSNGPVLLVAADAAIDPAALEALAAAATADTGAIAADNAIEAPAALVVPADDPAIAAEKADELGAAAARLREAGRLRLVATGGALCQRVRTPADAQRIERAMLAALTQPTDGFFARRFDRKISARLSIRLVRRGTSPNAITLAATLVGLAGAVALALPSHLLQVVGAALFVLSTILDGCDGEVARLSLTSSEFGRKLDLIGDNIVNAAVFIAVGWSAFHANAGEAMASLVWITLGGFALATIAGFSFSRWIERSGRKAELHNGYESLASRDFAYVILLLAVVGRLHWFVWLAAIGSYAFVAGLAVIRMRAARGSRVALERPEPT